MPWGGPILGSSEDKAVAFAFMKVDIYLHAILQVQALQTVARGALPPSFLPSFMV